MKRRNEFSYFLVAFFLFSGTFFSAKAQKQIQSVVTDAGSVKVQDMMGGIAHPWGMAFLPDGRLLVTEKSGALYIYTNDSTLSEPVEGTPEVFDVGQGGLLDVALDPDFQNNQYVYLSYAEPGEGETASTALGRGTWQDDRIQDFEVIFSQEPKVEGPNHFGGRIIFTGEDNLFLTLGERFKFDPAQNLANHLGTIVRIGRDGSIPRDNPFVGQADAEDEIWSYGHRNIEAAALNPNTGDLWVAEMGPLGGDELNQPEAGKNYGWPVVSWGEKYDGTDIPNPPTYPEFADAHIHWTPTISPSGMTYYTGDVFPEWKGSLLIGGLTSSGLVRVSIDEEEATEVERIPLGARIRDVVQAPDGSIYVLTDQDEGNIWRISPLEEPSE